MSEADEGRPHRSPRARFPARFKLRHRSEIRTVLESGERGSGRFLAVCVLRGTGEHRVVVVASRRVGGAVQRNRAKRLMRESYRLNRYRLGDPCSIALIARSRCARATRMEVEAELVSLLAQLGCLASSVGQPAAGGEE